MSINIVVTKLLKLIILYLKKLNNFFALDPDNGVACCRKCHIEKAHKDYCNFVSLANKKC